MLALNLHLTFNKGLENYATLIITARIQLFGAAKNHFIDPANKKFLLH